MAFEKKTWKDRITEYPTRRVLTKSDGTKETVTVSRSEGTVSQEGDAFSAENMNDLESRIATVAEGIGTFIGDVYYSSGMGTSITVKNSAINSTSIIDVYYNEDFKEAIADAGVSYSQTDGQLVITFGNELPYPSIVQIINNIRVVNV